MSTSTIIQIIIIFFCVSDYLSNSGDPYVFTTNINQLPIRTQLNQDQSREKLEYFKICLPVAQFLQSMDAEAVEPSCATIFIIDDDSKTI